MSLLLKVAHGQFAFFGRFFFRLQLQVHINYNICALVVHNHTTLKIFACIDCSYRRKHKPPGALPAAMRAVYTSFILCRRQLNYAPLCCRLKLRQIRKTDNYPTYVRHGDVPRDGHSIQALRNLAGVIHTGT